MFVCADVYACVGVGGAMGVGGVGTCGAVHMKILFARQSDSGRPGRTVRPLARLASAGALGSRPARLALGINLAKSSGFSDATKPR